MGSGLKRTPLFGEHISSGAKMSPFGGWEMPISYEGIIAEYNQCRKSAAVFDTCHMGQFKITGDISNCGIENAVTQSVGTIPVGKSRYGFILNERGGVIDDEIIFRVSESELIMVVNAATFENDFSVLKSRLKPGRIENISSVFGKIDLQGPLSREILSDILGGEVSLKYFGFSFFDFLGEKTIISRTGYTGELGFEIFVRKEKSVEAWRKILSDKRVKPAGLGARDILRLEMGYSLYGNDLDEDTTPVEAGLEMFVCYDKDFVGREALIKEKKEGLKKKKIAFKTKTRRSPRRHYKILRGGNSIGEVTSGSFSPALSCGIGLGFVSPEFEDEKEIVISDGRVGMEAEIMDLPFYRDGSLKN
ncbi:MAG: glycine cleavage system aminomethyltransferase GcvT [Elusimicrobia bacterium]|nr:glycine cleavage system aminomethyltransferase GcvT [Elusimicrobiota bacterium]